MQNILCSDPHHMGALLLNEDSDGHTDGLPV